MSSFFCLKILLRCCWWGKIVHELPTRLNRGNENNNIGNEPVLSYNHTRGIHAARVGSFLQIRAMTIASLGIHLVGAVSTRVATLQNRSILSALWCARLCGVPCTSCWRSVRFYIFCPEHGGWERSRIWGQQIGKICCTDFVSNVYVQWWDAPMWWAASWLTKRATLGRFPVYLASNDYSWISLTWWCFRGERGNGKQRSDIFSMEKLIILCHTTPWKSTSYTLDRVVLLART